MEANTITRRHVRDLLRHLSRDRMAESAPLADLELVRRAVERTGLRPSKRARQFELGRLLISTVEQELVRLRQQSGVRPAFEVADFRARIAEDFSHSNRELEAWSAIYHLYLRPDLDFGLLDLVGLLGDRHRRTVQRRLRRGVVALTVRLGELERLALSESRQEQVALRLPNSAASRLFGPDPLAQQAAGVLASGRDNAILALGGPAGIGKTETALRLARRSVEHGLFDDIIWLSNVSGFGCTGPMAEFLVTAFADRLPVQRPGNRGALRSHLARRRYLIVVDALDEPEAAKATIAALLDLALPSKVIVAGRAGWSGCDCVCAITVPPLDYHAALGLLRHEAAARGLTDVAEASETTLQPLVAATAGHPLAIRLATSQLRTSDVGRVTTDFAVGRGLAAQLFSDVWRATWQHSPPAARQVARAVVELCQRGPGPSTAAIGAMTGLGGTMRDEALRAAVDAGLIEPDGDVLRRHFRPGLFLRRFLHSRTEE